MKFFVYGTLRMGGRFDLKQWLQDNRIPFVFHGMDTINAQMYSSPDAFFPAIVLGEGKTIGEVYEIPDDLAAKHVLSHLDRIEGYPFLYDRVGVTTAEGHEATVYHMTQPNAELNGFTFPVESGDWFKR
jgi:gamma-glutamylcyclotransferase (GGCT)/AIG2-like uncharacterized protein YtfP